MSIYERMARMQRTTGPRIVRVSRGSTRVPYSIQSISASSLLSHRKQSIASPTQWDDSRTGRELHGKLFRLLRVGRGAAYQFGDYDARIRCRQRTPEGEAGLVLRQRWNF